MPVKRISEIKISQRGLFTAIYGNVNEDEFFVDDDLKKYSLWSQLYSYLKEEDYEIVLFYDTTNNFHSYSQSDLIKFLNLNINHNSAGGIVQKEKYVASHIKSPLRQQRLNAAAAKPIPPVDENPVHQSIQLVTEYGSSNNYYRTTINSNDILLTFFKKFLADTNRKVAVIIKYPDNSSFDFVNQYLTLFRGLNANYKIDDSENKIIIVYGCSNSESLIENLNRQSNYLFLNDYFKSLFLNAEIDSYKVKPETTFQTALPDQIEIRNWLNRKRLKNGLHLFNSVPLDKITLRFIQERKRLTDFENYDVPKFIGDISTKSGWDRLNDLIGLESVKTKVHEIVQFTKYRKENNSTTNYPAHLCFLGNPGTGKTTVASIITEIFKEEGVIPYGQYIETKAADLLGTEVGTAAKLINERCEAATGGVLFIDETASFIDEGTRAYGLLAIKTLLTWLENPVWNSKTIVIFAGYPDDIKNLFSKSDAGLRGRFSSENYLRFDNYTYSQLSTILSSNIKKEKLSISDEALILVDKIFQTLIINNAKNKEWDNARRARDIFNILFKNAVLRNSKTIEIIDIPEGLSSIVKGKAVTDIRQSKEFIELNNLIGLQNVKSAINDLIDSIEFEQYNIENGMQIEKSIQPLHLVFSGPPGTGKTTVARFFGGLLKNLGILSIGEVIEVDKVKLTKGHVGGTEEQVAEVLDKSMGNVLFIDEAYQLATDNSNRGIDYGKDAIEAILKRMEDDRDKFCVIAAGYTDEMESFLNSNSGLKSRFNSTILFPQYSIDELLTIFRSYCQSKNIHYNFEHDCIISQYMVLLQNREGKKFGNAREVRKLFDDTLRKQQKRLNAERKSKDLTNEEISLLKKLIVINDISEAANFLNSDLHNQIDFNCTTLGIPQPVIPVVSKPEIDLSPTVKPIEIKEKAKEFPKPLTELEVAISKLLYDYCIIDTNVWMETNDIKTHHQRLTDLKDLYAEKGKKLIAHGSTHEELKKFSDAYWKKINEKEKGLNPKISPKEYCGSKGYSLLKKLYRDKIVRIPGLESTHNASAYADKDIYEFASEEFEKGKSILFITNDNDCGMRVNSKLEDLKSNNQSLPNFDVLNMKQVSKLLDVIIK